MDSITISLKNKTALIALSERELINLRNLVNYAAHHLQLLEKTADLRTKLNSVEAKYEQDISIDTCAGKLTAWIDEGIHGPQVGVLYHPDNESPMDLFFAENYCYEDEDTKVEDPDEVHCYVYEDVTTENFTHDFIINKKDALEAIA